MHLSKFTLLHGIPDFFCAPFFFFILQFTMLNNLLIYKALNLSYMATLWLIWITKVIQQFHPSPTHTHKQHFSVQLFWIPAIIVYVATFHPLQKGCIIRHVTERKVYLQCHNVLPSEGLICQKILVALWFYVQLLHCLTARQKAQILKTGF